jgi:hypothetical protein
VYATAVTDLVGVGRLEAPASKATRSQQEEEAHGNASGGFLDGLPRS